MYTFTHTCTCTCIHTCEVQLLFFIHALLYSLSLAPPTLHTSSSLPVSPLCRHNVCTTLLSVPQFTYCTLPLHFLFAVDLFLPLSSYPFFPRLAKIGGYFLYIIHIYTCIYYTVSQSIGFGADEWVYKGWGNRSACTCIQPQDGSHTVHVHGTMNTITVHMEYLIHTKTSYMYLIHTNT